MSAAELRKLGALGRQVIDAIPQDRDLGLLGKIDETVDALADKTVKFQAMALAMDHYIPALQKTVFSTTKGLDELESIFSKSAALADEYYGLLVVKRQCAIDDFRLTEEDGIIASYDALLDQVAAFHNNLNTLAWIVGEHIAEVEEAVPGSFANADELFKAIGV